MTERREFGYIYTRGPIYWVGYSVDVDGKRHRHRESTHSTDKRKAEKLLDRRRAELGVPGAWTDPATKRTTFDELARIIRADYQLNERKSARTLETLLKRLAQSFAGRRAVSLTADELTRYVAARLTAGAARSTVRNEMNALRRALRLAYRVGKVASVPIFPTVTPGAPRAGFLEDADLPGLLAELPADLRPLVSFVAATGWRIGEAVRLEWASVDFSAGVVTLAVGSTKTGAGRVFPFAALPALADLLKEQREATSDVERRTGQIVARVFHRDGKPIRNFRDAWLGATTRAGLPGLLVHDLRRSAIRRFVRAGIPERVAMSLSGHKSRSVFDRYNIVSERDLAENVAKLAAVVAGPGKSLPFRSTPAAQSGQGGQ